MNAPPTANPADAPALVARTACSSLLDGPDRVVVELAPDLADVVSSRDSGVTTMRSRAWRSPMLEWLRYTEVANDRGTFIANLGAFPRMESSLPILQAEFVILAGRMFHVVLDARPQDGGSGPIGAHSSAGFLHDLRVRYPGLPQSDDMPEWAVEAMSAAVLWSHPRSAEAVAAAFACFGEFCGHFADLEGTLREAGEPDAGRWASRRAERLALRRRIRDNCIEGAPSRPFLKAMCGEAWTERFLADFLFPASLLE